MTTITTTESAKAAPGSAEKVVATFIEALNKENFDSARDCLSDDMVFDGVLGHRDGAEAYISDMKKMKFKYAIKKTFEDDSEVCLLYDIDMAGTSIFTCGWYKIEDNKIKSIKVVFDPRPVLEKSNKK